MTADLEAMLEALGARFADLIADRVVARMRAGSQEGWIAQSASPLGPRRHCALARKLIAHGDGAATRVGRRWLIRRERLDQELGMPVGEERDRSEALAEELGLRLVAGRR